MKKFLQECWSDESGVALVTVLGVILVITALAFGSYMLAQQALLEAHRVEDETQAYRAAASGLDRELATFQESGLGETYPKTGSTGDGTYTITVESIGASRYRLVSTGVGRDGSEEAVAQEFYFLNLWKMNFAGTGQQSLVSGGGHITGGSNIVGPFYMKGDLTLDASMSVQEGPIFVYGGDIKRTASGVRFGTEDLRVDVFCDGDTSTLPDGERKVFLGNVDASVPEINTPPLTQEMLEGYASTARAESVDNNMGPIARGTTTIHECNTLSPSGTDYTNVAYTSLYSVSTRRQADTTNANYKFIGAADGVIAPSGTGTHNLTISSSTPDFGWWGATYEGSALPTGYASAPAAYPIGVYGTNVHDDFAWDQSAGILYIEGTVFVDGDVTLDCDIDYVGNGTIVANGDIVVNGLLRPLGTTAQAQQNQWVIGLATPTGITFTANTGQMTGGAIPPAEEIRARTPDVAGAFYATQYVVLPEKLLVQGSVITGEIRCGQNNLWLVTNPYLPDYLPDSLPGSAGGLMTPTRWMRY
jgi:hypothetical protein